MQSTVISEMESMTSVKKMAFVFEKLDYRINFTTLSSHRTSLVEKIKQLYERELTEIVERETKK